MPYLTRKLEFVKYFVHDCSLWQATIMRLLIDIPIFSNILITVSSRFFIFAYSGMPWISIHSRLEYCSRLSIRRSTSINCSLNFLVLHFRRLDVVTATPSLLLMTVFSFGRSWSIEDRRSYHIVLLLLVNQFWKFEYKFRCLKWFFYNFCKGCNHILSQISNF